MSEFDDINPVSTRAMLLDCLKSRFFLIGVGMASLTWIIDPFIDAVILGEGTIIQQLTQSTTIEICFRSAFSVVIIFLWFYASYLLNKTRIAEEEMRESEEQLHSISKSATIAMIVAVDQSGTIVSWNTAAEKIFGYSKEEILGHPLVEIVPERYKDAHKKGFQRAAKTNDYRIMGQTVQVHGLRKNGEEFPIELSLGTWNKGKTKYFSAIIYDITERRQSEEELQKLSRAVEYSSSVVIITDLDGNIEYVNPKFTENTGYTIEEAIGENTSILKSGETLNETYTNLWDTISSGKEWKGELLNRKKDGSCCWTHNSISSVKDETGNITHFVGIQEDVSEHKQAIELLHENETRFRDIAESMSDWIWETDADNAYTYCSDKVETILGYRVDELIGKTLFDIMPANEVDRVKTHFSEIASDKGTFHNLENWCLSKDGRMLCFMTSGVPILDDEGKLLGYRGVDTDITERKQAEEALQIEKQFSDMTITSLPGIFYLYNNEGKFLRWNDNLEKVSGYNRDEIAQMHPLDFFMTKDQHTVKEKISEVFERGEAYIEADFLTKGNGTVPYFFTGKRIVIDNVQCLVGMGIDITERKYAEEQLSYQASHDALTGLINRHEFERRAERLLSTIKKGKSEHAMCYLDLDQFKVVNDTCGHAAGDELLRQLAIVLHHEVRKRDTLARLGGDEFGILMEHCSLEQAYRVADSLLKAIQDYQFAWEGHSFKVGVSIGLVAITEATSSLTTLLIQADAACYVAKDLGRNRIHVYQAEDASLAQRHGEMQWVTRIQHALETDRFCLYAQSIVPLDKRTDKHYELLIRMIGDKGEIIPPGAFLPAAERYNLITKLDYWVVEKAFNLLIDNPVFLEQVNFISINLSGPSLVDKNFQDFVVEQFESTKVPADKMCFEITETAAISNLNIANAFINRINVMGCRFALDDFGSGLSSFAYLKNLPVDYLKIDGMFVKDIVDDPIDHAMVKSINEVGQIIGMQTIAEFVENEMIKGMLKEMGVDYAQGFGVDRPMPFEELLGRANNVTDINNS